MNKQPIREREAEDVVWRAQRSLAEAERTLVATRRPTEDAQREAEIEQKANMAVVHDCQVRLSHARQLRERAERDFRRAEASVAALEAELKALEGQ